MASRNARATTGIATHEGAPSVPNTPIKTLERMVMTCLLWEPTFYESGDSTATQMANLVPQCDPDAVEALALRAKRDMYLRHVPLFLARELARYHGNGRRVYNILSVALDRPDNLTEYVSMCLAGGRKPLSSASRRALRDAFGRFDAYTLAKYQEKDKAVKLVDVLRRERPRPQTPEQAALWKSLRDGTLASPDTWEVALSSGADKKATFERLLSEKKLGGLATLRNLRNMQQAGVSDALIRERLSQKLGRVWPYHFISAARHAPSLEDALELGLLNTLQSEAPLVGRTGVLVDVSGSMSSQISTRRASKGEQPTRIDVASALAILVREVATQCLVSTFSDKLVLLAPRRGFALRDAIDQSQEHRGTYLRNATETLKTHPDWASLDRMIVITDEQSHDGIASRWTKHAYVINVAPYAHGVGTTNGWTVISGWSDRIVDYIRQCESVVE